jgi:single-stranded-DNA-specific exonuclease
MQAAGMLKRWRLAPAAVTGSTDHDAARLADALRLHPLAAQLLVRRGVADPDLAGAFLKPRLTDLHDPIDLPGCDDAARRIARAIHDGQPIVIYGDYDVDGITASAILWHTLTQLGARVSTYVPHRIDEGYGLNVEAIRKLADADPTPLIISVDCGITAVEPALAARDAGADLIITDHHEFHADALPAAAALVHPRLPGSSYPFGELCGAGVAFKLAWHVARVHCNSERVPESVRDLLMDLLSYVALGTVADLVPLVGENRVMTLFGLSRVKQTRFVGLNAMIDAASLRDEKIDAYHVGFVLGPRLNACGRMGHARQAVHLLTAAQHNESQQLAEFLTLENDRRRRTERDIFKQAEKMVEDEGMDSPDCRAIVLGSEGWHVGVVGIVASRLVERFARPVVMLSYENGHAHGSARSVAGLSIHEAFCACSQHLTSYGGHAMAAGLRMPTQHVAMFRESLIEFINARLSPDDLVNVIDADASCTLGDLSLELFQQLQRLAPFGRGNPSPKLWLRGVRLNESPRRMGKRGDHLSLTFSDGRRAMRGVAFGKGDLADQLHAGADIEAIFEPKVSTWQGVQRPELHIDDLRVV